MILTTYNYACMHYSYVCNHEHYTIIMLSMMVICEYKSAKQVLFGLIQVLYTHILMHGCPLYHIFYL